MVNKNQNRLINIKNWSLSRKNKSENQSNHKKVKKVSSSNPIPSEKYPSQNSTSKFFPIIIKNHRNASIRSFLLHIRRKSLRTSVIFHSFFYLSMLVTESRWLEGQWLGIQAVPEAELHWSCSFCISSWHSSPIYAMTSDPVLYNTQNTYI